MDSVLASQASDMSAEAMVEQWEVLFPTRPGAGSLWERLGPLIRRLRSELDLAWGPQQVGGFSAPGLGPQAREPLTDITAALDTIAAANRPRRRTSSRDRQLAAHLLLVEGLAWRLIALLDEYDAGCTPAESGLKALRVTAQRASEGADLLVALVTVAALAHAVADRITAFLPDPSPATAADDREGPPGRIVAAEPCWPNAPPARLAAPQSAAELALAA